MHRRLTAPGWKLVSLVTVTIWLCAFALSAALPSLAASDAASALVNASSASASTISSAESDAALASRLDPLSDAGPRAQATIAIHRGRFSRARAYLSEAVGREPTDELAWEQLALLYSELGDRQDAEAAARRVAALDPHGQLAHGLARAGLVPSNAAK
jgi:Flp pilus assembly protein TadD